MYGIGRLSLRQGQPPFGTLRRPHPELAASVSDRCHPHAWSPYSIADAQIHEFPARPQAQCDNARHQQTVKLTSRSEEHTSELQSLRHLVCRLLLEKKNRAWTREGLSRASPLLAKPRVTL